MRIHRTILTIGFVLSSLSACEESSDSAKTEDDRAAEKAEQLAKKPGELGRIIKTAHRTKVQADLKAVVAAAKQYWAVTGAYPESIEELVRPVDDAGNELPGLEELPKDPWGNIYEFGLDSEGKPFAICLGSDRVEGGQGDEQDLRYPEDDESY